MFRPRAGRLDGRGCRPNSPGNSVNEIGERINGGAVSEDRSPEKEAMLFEMRRDRQRTNGSATTKDIISYGFTEAKHHIRPPRMMSS